MNARTRLNRIGALLRDTPIWPRRTRLNYAGNLAIDTTDYTREEWNSRAAQVAQFMADARHDLPALHSLAVALLDEIERRERLGAQLVPISLLRALVEVELEHRPDQTC